jgi:hypothetical protein
LKLQDGWTNITYKRGAKLVNKMGGWWLTSVILATKEAEIRRIVVRSQPGKIVLENTQHKKALVE